MENKKGLVSVKLKCETVLSVCLGTWGRRVAQQAGCRPCCARSSAGQSSRRGSALVRRWSAAAASPPLYRRRCTTAAQRWSLCAPGTSRPFKSPLPRWVGELTCKGRGGIARRWAGGQVRRSVHAARGTRR